MTSTDTRTARIHLDPIGANSTIDIGGHDLSKAVRALAVTAEVGQVPVVSLDLVVLDGEIDGEVVVTIPDATRDVLVALGWIPPMTAEERHVAEQEACAAEVNSERVYAERDADSPF